MAESATKRGDDLAEEIEGVDEKDFDFLREYEENSGAGELVKKSANLDPKKWYFIRFPARVSKLETKVIFIGINGQPWQFQRGKIICVPWEILAQLDNTDCKEWELGESDKGMPQMKYEPKFRVNYELIRSVTQHQAEIWYRDHCNRDLPKLSMTKSANTGKKK